MNHTVFRNASGLPDFDQVTTARDLGVLARHSSPTSPAITAISAPELRVPRPRDPQSRPHVADLPWRGRDENRLDRGVRPQPRNLRRAQRGPADRRRAWRRVECRAGWHMPRCSTRASTGWTSRRKAGAASRSPAPGAAVLPGGPGRSHRAGRPPRPVRRPDVLRSPAGRASPSRSKSQSRGGARAGYGIQVGTFATDKAARGRGTCRPVTDNGESRVEQTSVAGRSAWRRRSAA